MDELEALLRLGRQVEKRPDGMLRAAAQLLRLRDRHGHLKPLAANLAQRSFEARRGRENVVLKARQMGISTWIAGRFFLRTILRPGTLTLQVAHTREAAEALLSISKRMWEELPEVLQAGPLRLTRCSAGQMMFGEIGSEIRVASASDGNAGRGFSVQNLHCSEVSRWAGDADATLAGLRATLAPDGELVLESTPSGAYGAFYEAWRSGIDPGGQTAKPGLVRHFLPWWLEPAYTAVPVDAAKWTAEEVALSQRHGLTTGQIGFRRGLEERYGTLRNQEFAENPESCFRATGSCCFDVPGIERRMSELEGAAHERRNGALRVWLTPRAGNQYLVAVDTAGGSADGDYAAAQVLDVATGLQCAELQERLRPAELARVCAELGREYGSALLVVERNNHGSAVLAFLQTEQRYERVYLQNGEAGWLTSMASKPEMVARLATLLSASPERFFSKRLLGECRNFVMDERGRAGAVAGGHDDLVMAMAIGQAVRAELLLRGRVGVKAA